MSVATNLISAADADFESGVAGWTGGSGVTLSQSTRFASGTHSMLMTPASTQTVTATCKTRVAVTPGTEYMAYASFANTVAGTGHVATVTVTWYSVSTGGTAISQVVTPGVTLPNATTWSAPPPQTMATPPAGATWAEISVAVTAVTHAAPVVVDTVAFGRPSTWAGSLLPYTVASVEIDSSAWTSGTNTAVSRSTLTSWEGWYSLQSTATATGPTRTVLAQPVPVTPGLTYEAFTMVYAPSVAGQFPIGIEWVDSGGTVLATDVASGTTTVAAGWVRATVAGQAPVGTAAARIVYTPSATVAGQQWLTDQAFFAQAPTIAGNLLTYSESSIEVDASGWTAVSGCTLSYATAHVWEGTHSLGIVASGTVDAVVTLARTVPVTPGMSFEFAPRFWRAGADSSTQTQVGLAVEFQTADGSAVGGSAPLWGLSGASAWFSPTASDVAPADAVAMSVTLSVPAGSAGTYYMDGVYVGPGGLAAVAAPIAGEYGARISLSGLTEAGRDVWDLSRTLSDGSTTPVRGQDGDLTGIPITGDVAVVDDYEAPLGVPVSYSVVTRKLVGNSLNVVSSDPIIIAGPDGVSAVLKDPGLPARLTTVSVTTLPDWTRTARQGVNAVRGRVNPIIISDVRTSRTGSLAVTTETNAEKMALWWLLDPGSTLLLQWPAGWNEDDVYVQVGDVVEAHIVDYARYGDRTWTLPLTVVDRPIGGIVGSPDRTWGSLTTDPDIGSWSDVMAYGSWLDVLTGVKP